MEVDISALMKRIQSVSYIPTYSDGKATVYFIKGVDKVSSQLTLDFEISPKDAVAELAEIWQQALSIKAVYTATRAAELIDMPITNVEVDDANGVISVTSSAGNLSAEFASGIQQASARLAISDGITEVTIPNGVVVLGRGASEGALFAVAANWSEYISAQTIFSPLRIAHLKIVATSHMSSYLI